MNIYYKLIDYFEPDKSVFGKGDDYQIAEFVRRSRLIIGITLGSGALIFLMFVIRVFLEGIQNKSLILLALMGAVVILLPFLIKKTGKFWIAFWVFMSLSALVLPIRVLSTGGMSSSTVVWFMLFVPVAFFVMGQKHGLLVFVLVSLEMMILSQAHRIGLPIQVYDASPTVRFFVVYVALVVISLLMWVFERERLRGIKQVRETEQKLARSHQSAVVNQLAAGVAHNINNPLAIVLGFVQLSKKQLDAAGELDRDDLKKKLLRIEKNTERISHIVHDIHILTSSRPHGRNELINMEVVINECLDTYSSEIENAAIRVSVVNHSKNCMLFGPLELFEKVFSGLFDNSIKSLLEAQNRSIKISLNNEKIDEVENLVIRFADTGMGVPDKVRDIFLQPFFMENDLAMNQGLGLALCRAIIEGNKGSFNLNPDSQDTEFIITLPLA